MAIGWPGVEGSLYPLLELGTYNSFTCTLTTIDIVQLSVLEIQVKFFTDEVA